jgi:flagellar hook-associated protein 1 FlgK
VNASGKLVIASSNQNVTFSFGEDTSGALAALGINTFFTGSDATNIAVNGVLTNDPSMLATGRGNVTGSNGNAQALALAGSAAVGALKGKSLTGYYGDYIGTLSAQAKNASDNVTAQNAIHDTLYAQQQAISGVSMDEEAINLTKYQRAFEGSARFITVVDEMMQTLLGLIT